MAPADTELDAAPDTATEPRSRSSRLGSDFYMDNNTTNAIKFTLPSLLLHWNKCQLQYVKGAGMVEL